MTEGDKDAEIGRTVREYKDQSEKLECLLSRLARIASCVERVRNAIGDNTLEAAANQAASSIEECDVARLFKDIADTDKSRRMTLEALHRQGLGAFVRDEINRT